MAEPAWAPDNCRASAASNRAELRPRCWRRPPQPLLAKLQANPKDFETLRQLGNLYYDGQAYPQAIEYYNKALAIDPKNPDVLTDLGTAYWYTGDADKALAEFDKSLAIRPNHPGTMFNVGIVMWQGKKDPKGAVVVWEQLLKSQSQLRTEGPGSDAD